MAEASILDALDELKKLEESLRSRDAEFKERDFFFSSRRRHTRWPRDWSSDVCSSDLSLAEAGGGQPRVKLTLNPPCRVEVSLAMAPEHEPPQGHSDSSASLALTSNGMIGQSFHSRSKP